MKTKLSTLICLLISSISVAQLSIGHLSKTFVDPDRNNRNIPTEIYYPATTSGENTPAAAESYPVIIFGHGFVMAWDAYENLWEEFVPRGYIMVFPRTEGNAFSTNHQSFGWDLQFLVSAMQSEGILPASILYNHISSETALMGHSMGGGASFLAADSLCTNGNLNLKTLIGLAPAESSTNGVSSIGSSANITLPSLILSGTQDGVTPPNDHHIPMYNALSSSCKTLINISGGGHCYFANSNAACDFGESTSSTGIAISRIEQQQTTYDFVNLWLDYTLKSNCESFHIFQDSLINSQRITFEQQCLNSPPTIDNTVSQSNGQLISNENGATSYQWVDCNDNFGAIINETNQTFAPTSNGDYAVQVSVNGCSAISDCISFSASLGIIETSMDLNYFQPNPATMHITIQNFNLTGDLFIYDIKGKVVLSKPEVSSNDIIEIGHLNAGSYFISIRTEKTASYEKMIKL